MLNKMHKKKRKIFLKNAINEQKLRKKVLKIKVHVIAKHLHVLGMVTNAFYQLVGLDLSSADFVDGSEKREFLFHVLGLQHVVDFFSGDWALKKER